MNTLLGALLLVLLCGCAAIEQTPEDIQRKLAEPTKGRLYERDPLKDY